MNRARQSAADFTADADEMMSGNAVQWIVEGNEAKLACGPLAAAVTHGETLTAQKWSTRNIRGSIALAYSGPNFHTSQFALAETYTRGGDLVTTYAESGEHRVAPQLYWRASFLEACNTAKVELIVSVRTDLLDSQPASIVRCLLSSAANLFHTSSLDVLNFKKQAATMHLDAAESRSHLFVFRMLEQDFSFAQMVHPTDFVSAELAVDTTTRFSLISPLFPERLEKGVIRRGRICSWFLPTENDLETAVTLARQFVDEPLPLTT